MNNFEAALDNIKVIKQRENYDTDMAKSKLAIRGTAVGLVIGLMYGWYKKQNLYIYGVVGAVAGGVINYFLIPKVKEANVI